MTDPDFNRNKVEQMCLKKLTQADIVPQFDKPYSLQLLMWTLDGHQNTLSSRVRADVDKLLSVARKMFEWDAKTIQAYLVGDAPWPKDGMKELANSAPEILGSQLAENLHAKLQAEGSL